MIQLVFIVVSAFILTWLERKIKARSQFRVGPPFYQQFADIGKLLQKQNLRNFLASPVLNFLPGLSLAAVLLLAALIPFGAIGGAMDIFTLIFFFLLISFSYAVLGLVSKSGYGFFGAKREILQLVSFELPFVLSLVAVGVLNGGTSLNNTAFSPLLVPAMAVFITCTLAKTKRSPFDIPNATQEIIEGPATELSGPSLAALQLTEWTEAYLLCSLFFVLFFGLHSTLVQLVASWGLFLAFVFIDVLTPRIKIQDSVKLFGMVVIPLSIASVMLCYYATL